MSIPQPSKQSDDVDSVVHSIDRVLDELADLAESDISAADFYQSLLDRAVLVTDGMASALWCPGPNDTVFVAVHSQLSQLFPNTNHRRYRADRDEIRHLLSSDSTRPATHDATKEAIRLAIPIQVASQNVGAIAIYCDIRLGDASLRVIEQFGEALAELSVDFERNHRTKHHRESVEEWKSLHQFAVASHRSLNVRRTAHHLANEGRVYLAADRVSIFSIRSWHTKMLASSGLSTVDSRSEQVRHLRALARKTAENREPVFIDEQGLDVPKGMQKPLEAYLAKSPSKQLALIPLSEGETGSSKFNIIGVAAIEIVKSTSAPQLLEKCQYFAPHASSALSQALQYQAIPFRPLWRAIGWVLSQFRLDRVPRTAIFVLAIAALIAPLVFVEVDFRIEARGELRPSIERHVFAPANGFVSTLSIEHGKVVHQGDPLASLSSPELDLEMEAIDGELRTTNQRIDGLVVAMNQVDPSDDQALFLQSQIGAQISELEQKIVNLNQQKQMIQDRLDELEIASPIDGQIVTWEVEQVLKERPVRQGDSLMKVADIEGEWELQLRVPDRKIGHVLAAAKEDNRPLQIEFVLETDPETLYQAQLGTISASTRAQAGELPYVNAIAEFDESGVGQLRPGASVVARIDCGRRSLGYVWLHDSIDALRRKLFW